MDIIYLRGLRVDTIIGIYDWERHTPQTVVIDLEVGADITEAARTEDIAATVSYKDIADRIEQFVSDSRFQLVETLAERIAELVLTEFKVPWLKLAVGKPGAVPAARDVGVIIERRAEH